MSNITSSSLAAYQTLVSSFPFRLSSLNLDLTTVLAGLGLASVSYNAFRLLAALTVYLLPSRLHLYHHGSEPYALVTGASDGIGFAG
jgi:17beta-estradiol 17-dehydrogenase / very-long-chain 3-oxoacyl-CoA reductase